MTPQRPPRRTVSPLLAATALTVAVLTGCSGTTDLTDGANGIDAISPGAGHTSRDPQAEDRPSTEATSPAPSPRDADTPDNGGATQEADMQIEIRVADELFTATVDDTPAGRDLLAQLPQTIQMRDHGGVEKTGPLRSPLSLDGQPDGADPDVGDLGYYAPGNDLVLYYGDQGYYNGIVILGRLDDNAAPRLEAMAGDVTATVTPAGAS